MKKLLLLFLSIPITLLGQTTYTWNNSGSGAYTTSTNWTPNRTTPATDDILVFDGSITANPWVTGVPTETIGKLIVQNNAYVRLQATTAVTLTIAGGSGTDLDIQAGSTLREDSVNAITISLSTGATGSIAGTFIASNSTNTAPNPAHRLLAADASAIIVPSGGQVEQGIASGANYHNGNLFGNTGTANIVTFQDGSTYIQRAGSNPFGLAQPNSKVVFSSGSTYKFYLSGSPALTGRTFGNFVVGNGANCNPAVGLSADCIMYNITQEAGAAIAWTSSGTRGTGALRIRGNITQSGTFALTLANNSSNASGAIIFEGSSAQSISGSGTNTTSLKNIVAINNSNGLTLNRAVSADTIKLGTGKIITTTSNLLTLSANGSITGGSSSSFIDGPLAHTIASTSSTSKTYPVGKSSAYRPVTLTITQDAVTSTVYTAEVFNSAPSSRTLPGSLDKVSSVRYVNVAKGSGANVTNATIVMNYDTDDGVTDAPNLRIAKDDGAGNWVDLGGTGTANTSGSITSTTNFTSFGDFVLANNVGGSNPLPVELTSFTAITHGKGVELRWSTATEVNNYGFEVERKVSSLGSARDDKWAKIGFVEGAGNSNAPKEYSFTDALSANGKYLYRLKQIDRDGKFEYSHEVEVVISHLPQKFALMQNYPNPFNPATTISFTVPSVERATLKVYDLTGREVGTLFNEVANPGQTYHVVFNGKGLASGIYIYVLQTPTFREVKKMQLIK